MNEVLFSVVIPSYGGGEIWKSSVESVLMQDYPSIELVFCDDGTEGFDPRIVSDYIAQNKSENLRNYTVISNETNLGTVLNLRQAHAHCSGKYLLHLAMDDVLCDKSVLTCFAHSLNIKNSDVLGIYGNALVCDEQLKPLGMVKFDAGQAQNMNRMTSEEQFCVLCQGCCIHMGATAFRRDDLVAAGDFDIDFRLIEDWPFFLESTQKGWRFQYSPFDAILYRNGGVTDKPLCSPTKRACLTEHLQIYEQIIIPAIQTLPLIKRVIVYARYALDRRDISNVYGSLVHENKKQRTHILLEITAFFLRYWQFEAIWALGGCCLLLMHGGWHWQVLWGAFIIVVGLLRNSLRRINLQHKLKQGEI